MVLALGGLLLLPAAVFLRSHRARCRRDGSASCLRRGWGGALPLLLLLSCSFLTALVCATKISTSLEDDDDTDSNSSPPSSLPSTSSSVSSVMASASASASSAHHHSLAWSRNSSPGMPATALLLHSPTKGSLSTPDTGVSAH